MPEGGWVVASARLGPGAGPSPLTLASSVEIGLVSVAGDAISRAASLEAGKTIRHQINCKCLKETTRAYIRATVTVERQLFKRERILWIDNDEPVATASDNRDVERSILSAIAKAL